ncbi:MAG: hypothetical protein Q8862_13160 [Bacteroidota bacterium]|nr:hypothetical protein [Bacteroidota bacterium]MDP4205699.1 hypothetical protein [Bacteroidota bacterium]
MKKDRGGYAYLLITIKEKAIGDTSNSLFFYPGLCDTPAEHVNDILKDEFQLE